MKIFGIAWCVCLVLIVGITIYLAGRPPDHLSPASFDDCAWHTLHIAHFARICTEHLPEHVDFGDPPFMHCDVDWDGGGSATCAPIFIVVPGHTVFE